jgi:hypothetical protein
MFDGITEVVQERSAFDVTLQKSGAKTKLDFFQSAHVTRFFHLHLHLHLITTSA